MYYFCRLFSAEGVDCMLKVSLAIQIRLNYHLNSASRNKENYVAVANISIHLFILFIYLFGSFHPAGVKRRKSNKKKKTCKDATSAVKTSRV